MIKKILIFITVFLLKNSLDAVLIDKSGKYTLGDNVIETGNGITISASQVILDLDQHFVVGSTNGIVIQPGVSSVAIINGAIANASNVGVQINEDCRSITLSNLRISGCLNRGIEINGILTDDSVKDITITNVDVRRCAIGPSGDAAFFAQHCSNLFSRFFRLTECGNTTNHVRVFTLENTNSVILRNVVINTCVGSPLTVFDVVDSVGLVAEEVFLLDHTVSDITDSLIGFNFSGVSRGNVLRNTAIGTSKSLGDFKGYAISDGAQDNTFSLCSVVQNSGLNCTGFSITGTQALKNIFNECNVVQNHATDDGELMAAFFIEDSSENSIRLGSFAYNLSMTGTAVGIWFSPEGDSVNHWTIDEVELIRNVGKDNESSFGVYALNQMGSLFSRTLAYDNGNISANQLKGVPSGSVTQLNPANLNTAASRWANIVVTS